MMFSSIVVSGNPADYKGTYDSEKSTIVSVALGVGYGMGANTAIRARDTAGCPADLRRFRNRSGGAGCDP